MKWHQEGWTVTPVWFQNVSVGMSRVLACQARAGVAGCFPPAAAKTLYIANTSVDDEPVLTNLKYP